MEVSDNLYITLFSDADKDKFPQNTPTQFRNSLPSSIDFTQGLHEVGLKKIVFECNPPPPLSLNSETRKEIQVQIPKPIGEQKITFKVRSAAEFNYTYLGKVDTDGFLTEINLDTEKKYPQFKCKFLINLFPKEEKTQITVVLDTKEGSWLEIPDFFSQLIGLPEHIPAGRHTGEKVALSLYDDLGKPDKVTLTYCEFQMVDEQTQPAPEFGFEPFIKIWAKAVDDAGATIGLLHHYYKDQVNLQINIYEPGETMKLSPVLNLMMNLPSSFEIKSDLHVTFPASNFLPDPIPPTPPTPYIIDSDSYIHILCDIVEEQRVGGSLLPWLTTLKMEKEKSLVQKDFESVSYVPLRKQDVQIQIPRFSCS